MTKKQKIEHLKILKRSRSSKLCSLLLATLLLTGSLSPRLLYAAPQANLVYPLLGTKISSDFGNRRHPIYRSVRHHDGVDLAAPDSSPVRAISDGVVVFADPYKGYGKLVVVKHQNGLTSHYGHLESIAVGPGQRIKAGALLGRVGHTGRVTGPHLHFEVRINGKAQDPQKYIPGLALQSDG